MKNLVLMSTLAAAIFASASASAAVIDTINSTSPAANANPNYFVPDAADTYSSPYYRYYGSNWEWSHNAITSTYTTAALSISAFDVDAAEGELDIIQGYETSTSSWVDIGSLLGASDIYSFTTFNLGSSWADEIGTGLMLRILIDQNNEGWAVALAKSVLTTDGAGPGNPNPGTEVPLPAAAWLFGSALMGFAGFRRKAV